MSSLNDICMGLLMLQHSYNQLEAIYTLARTFY